MALRKLERQKKDILEELKKENSIKIILEGEAGVGKTWMAREICESAISGGICYASLWLSLNMKFDDWLLYESIARQLSVHFTSEEWEHDENNMNYEQTLESLKRRILTKLKALRSANQDGNKCLILILDDEGKKMKEDLILPKLKTVIPESDQNMLKVVISRRNDNGGQISEDAGAVIKVEPNVFTIESLSEDESLALLRHSVDKRVAEVSDFGQLSVAIAKKSFHLPAAIILVAGALNYIGQHDSKIWTMESALEEAANDLIPLLQCTYDMLPRRLDDCFWHSMQLFSRYGGVHYNELITHWLIEGYLGSFNHLEEAYDHGHQILMELINCGILKIQEDNIIVMEGLLLNLVDRRHRGFFGTASVGLASVLDDEKWRGLGRVTQIDGIIKTLLTGKKGDNISTIVIDGSRLSREVPQTFFQYMPELEVLVLFNPRLNLLPSSLSKMSNLFVLVLRGCDLLEDVSCIKDLKNLTVLEISNAFSLKKIPDNLFEQMSHIRSLNLSGLSIKSLPSISNLKELRWLNLRQCSRLEDLPKLQAFTNLEVLDLCSATSFKRFQDKNFAPLQKLQILDLSHTKIQRLPIFQDAKVFPYLRNLKRLLLNGCNCLARLPSLKPLSGLQILDLSGAVILKEINDESFEKKDDLKVLDLSGTLISQLSFDNLNICDLKLKGCSNLEELPCTETLKQLELLDLSDACNLVRIKDKSFEHLKLLRCLNLSKTKITSLPSISNLPNLRKLLLRDCSSIKKLQNIEGLVRLEVLDLSGCRSLTVIQEESFKQMSRLQTLNLSEAKIKCIPYLCNPSNLLHLVLRNCTNLEKLPPLDSLSKLEVLDLSGSSSLSEIKAESIECLTSLEILDLSKVKVEGTLSISGLSNLINLRQLSLQDCLTLESEPHLEAFTKLTVLDLSGTAVRSFPSLDKLSQLCKLLLRGCSSLEKLPPLKSLRYLQVLDLSGTRIKKLPDGISELTCLTHLDLPDLKVIEEVGWENINRIPEELNWDQCSISQPVEIHSDNKQKPSILVNGTKFFQFLKENSKLGETYLKQIFFSVYPMNQDTDPTIYRPNDELMNNIYFQLKHFSHPKERVQTMEIHGFNEFPSDLEDILKDVEYVFLVENVCMTSLSDLGGGNMKKMKGCWLERCSELKSILCNGTDVELGENLEILCVSNLPKLQSLCSEKVNFNNLQDLHIDCCTMLESICPLPSQLENLKILQIKFCERLKTVFTSNKSSKCVCPRLHTLRLLELPELTSIGAMLPALDTFDPRRCPKLKDSKESLKRETEPL
ncbi:hypothetical protein JCGZ_10817 [Jatropha curcas]|uniref:NB-ARC domain-containing protein n=1 Tax=Jatropha curcas TaxID=180498 RepID=A0A067KU99_JATCU|nr:putative disease resistance protein At4g19050 [Jatropha curcas]XP_037491439.1 putative disease resistance protein At4g19050 [Jatropha curcas]KDP35434.1 hypothetical protein JCGZ_10817 [Jatropha curcas]